MLWQKLSGTNANKKVTLVGYKGVASTNALATTSATVSLTSLTGGVASSASSGDIVIVAVVVGSTINHTFAVSGYTQIADLFANSASTTAKTSLGVYYRVLTGADTSVTCSWNSGQYRYAVIAYVFRDVDATTPLDVTSTTNTSLTVGVPDAPSITTVTNNCTVIAIGAAQAFASPSTPTLSALTAPSGMENFYTLLSYNKAVALGFATAKVASAGTYNPASFGGGNASGFTSASVTIALRPK